MTYIGMFFHRLIAE